jgi:hypothetical protein
VPSLTDLDEQARQAAILAFRFMGQSAVPVLRALRRSAAPPRPSAARRWSRWPSSGPSSRTISGSSSV